MPNIQFSVPRDTYLFLDNLARALDCSPDLVAKYVVLLGMEDLDVAKLYGVKLKHRHGHRPRV